MEKYFTPSEQHSFGDTPINTLNQVYLLFISKLCQKPVLSGIMKMYLKDRIKNVIKDSNLIST